MKASVKVKLLLWKTNNEGEHPVVISIIKDRKRSIIYTGYSFKVSEWDEKNKCVKKSHPLFNELLLAIANKKQEALKTITDIDVKGNNVSADAVKQKILKKNKSNTISVFEYFDEIIQTQLQTGKLKYRSIFKTTKANLYSYRKGKDLKFSDITPVFLTKYEEWNIQRDLGLNSLFVYMRTLRTLINMAIKNELCDPENYAFKKFSLQKYAKIETTKRAITKDEFYKIYDYKTTTDIATNSKNYFVFSYYAWGINFIDLAFLKWSDLNDDTLSYTRRKTGDKFLIKLPDPAIKILKFYKKKYYISDDQFIFPILDKNKHVTPLQIDYRLQKVLKQTNKELKAIGIAVGIKTKITTYVSRHTFATVLKRSGTRTGLISEMMGHETESITQTYLDSFGNDELFDTSKLLLR